jgi:hypothetical protein
VKPARRIRAGQALLLVALGAGGSRASADPARSVGLATSSSLRARLGVGAAEALLGSDRSADRVRGLERLGRAGTPRALALLARALEPGGSAATAGERLTAVRSLAEHASDPLVRRALGRVLGGHATPSSPGERAPLDDLAQDTAALALARAATPDALASLGKALEGSGRAARAAGGALLAYPPRDLAPVLEASRVPSLALATTLDALGDQRGFAALRLLVRTGSSEVRALAALGLTRLGDYETLAVARRWLGPDTPAASRVVAARILALGHAPDAAAATAKLLRDATTSSGAIDLALDAPDPALVPALAALLSAAEGDREEDLLTAMGRAGGEQAIRALQASLAHPTRGVIAAMALARMPGSDARLVLEHGLDRAETRRLATLSAAVRFRVLGDLVPGLQESVARLAASKDAAARTTAASASVLLDSSLSRVLSRSSDEAILLGIAPLLPLEPAAAATAAARLEGLPRGHTRTALAIVLAVPGAEDHVPTSVLVGILAENEAAAPLAARALAARDELRDRPVVDALLASPDPRIRSHAALGLGRSPEPDATGRLQVAYRFEADSDVREAIIRALSVREEPTRTGSLALAAALDPDERVRSLGRLALAGARLPEAIQGNALLWLPAGAVRHPREGGISRIRSSTGLVLPAPVGLGGAVLIAGLSAGSVALRVAPEAEPEDARSGGASGNPKIEHVDRPGQGH